MTHDDFESNIWKTYLAKFIGSFELAGAIFILFLLSNSLTMGQVMILQSIFTVLIVLFEVPSGVFADLFGLKRSLVLAEVCAASGFIIYGFSHSFHQFLIAEVMIALGFAFGSGADSAFIYDSLKEMKKERKYKKVMGRVYSIVTLSLGISAFVGGLIAQKIGYKPLFFICGATIFIASLFWMSAKEPGLYKKLGDKKYFLHLKEGLKFTYEHKQVKRYIIYYSMFSGMTYMLYYLIQPYMQGEGLGLSAIGLVVGVYFVFGALGYYLAERIVKKFKDEDKVLLALLLITAVLFLGISTLNVWVGIAFIFGVIFFAAIRDIILEHRIHNYTPSSHRATVLSIKNLSSKLMYTIFGPAVGYVTDLLSLRAALLMIGISLVIFWLGNVVMFSIYKKRYGDGHQV